jgi:hypothetical protein
MSAQRNQRFLSASLILTLSLLAISCTGGSVTRIAYQPSGLSLEAPAGWKVFEPQQVLSRHQSSAELRRLLDHVPWAIAFDAAPSPSLEHVFVFNQFRNARSHPSGYARVRHLTNPQRSRLSAISLRNELIPVDALVESGHAKLVRSERVEDASHRQGARLLVELTLPNGEQLMYDQTSVVDSAVRTIHLLAIGCDSSCYRRYGDMVERVVSSMIGPNRG